MRRSSFIIMLMAFSAGMLALATPGEAARSKYCSFSDDSGTQCMYASYKECRAAVRGTGADCIRNPRAARRTSY